MLVSKAAFIKFMKYSIVGCVSTIVYFISVFILVELFRKDPLSGTAVSFILMTIVSFILNMKYTFGGDFTIQKLLRFFTVSTIGFTLNYLIIFTIVHVLSLHYMIGEITTMFVIPVINFLLNYYWTFKKH